MPYSKSTIDEIRRQVEKNGLKAVARKRGVSKESIKRALRKHGEKDTEKSSEKPVLIMPDIHAPYHHPDAIEFLKWAYQSRGCGSVVNVGDLFDFHAMSRHVTEIDAPNAEKEYDRALEFVAELTDVFPEGDLVLGNHDLIPQRQMKDIGLSTRILKSHNELYGLPKGWTVHPHYYVIKPDSWNVLVEHGIGSAGKYGCANTAKEKRCSYVQGHVHSAVAVIYSTNHENTIFGMNAGCLVDSGSLAMRYGKYGVKKGVLACGVVYSGSHAEVITMEGWR